MRVTSWILGHYTENCEIPAVADGYMITSGIRRIAHEYGSVTAFKAYCETPELMSPKYSTMRSELHACGVSVIDCPHNGRKDTADKKTMGKSPRMSARRVGEQWRTLGPCSLVSSIVLR